jgi:peptide-methionine (S)-S-oxide reductase
MSSQKTERREVATLGGGCFWCTEAVFNELRGIEKVESGYAGGSISNPSYEQVCNGETGHAEVVQVTFNPDVLSYHDLLKVFFTVHDPTSLNRQGADVGTQYRSVILYNDAEQKKVAEEVMKEVDAARVWGRPIVTELSPLKVFYKAEDYHQEFFKQNQVQPYCQVVIAPKVTKFRKQYTDRLKR